MNRNCHLRRSGVATRACSLSNETVRSPGDNVPCHPAIGVKGASQGAHEESRDEVVVNPVTRSRRKDSCYAGAKRHAARWRCCKITFLSSVVQPGKSDPLKALWKVSHAELGKPDESRWHATSASGSPTVRKEEDSAGKGGWKKRMLPCNGADRAAVTRRYPPRKGADFQLVLAKGDILGRQNPWGC
jgi:hypothetical protein